MPPSVNPIVAAASALVVNIGNALVAFNVFGTNVATVVEAAAIGALGLGYVIANAIHAHAPAPAAK